MATLRCIGALLAIVMGLIVDASAKNTSFITGTDLNGLNQTLALDRRPALYSGNFGDCLGGQSLLNVTKFDAALYRDNSTVLFHLDGSTNLKSEPLMLYLSIQAYGKTRFSLTVNPCLENITSLCPMNASSPVTAFAVFPIDLAQVSGIPEIAYEIPDLEGYARLQLFANSSQTEIACFQAAMLNGASFSQPVAIGSGLGCFTIIAIIASFATAAYGVSVPHMRTHYAHSISVVVIFETFQAIFFSGALSLLWPSVLTAWWSNFSWAGGLIPIPGMLHSIDSFAGINGNASQVGGAGSTIINNNGGGLAQQIYGRSLASRVVTRMLERATGVEKSSKRIMNRQTYDPDNPYDYNWNGKPVTPGMPIPGDWSGFAGTLSELEIPGPDAFLIALIWLLIALTAVAFLLITLKIFLEGLARLKWIRQDRLEYFRSHWTAYLAASILRTLFIAFSSLSILAMFQFAHGGNTRPLIIGAIVFGTFIIGMGGLAAYALRVRLRLGKFATEPDRILFYWGKLMGCIPFPVHYRSSQLRDREFVERPIGSLPFVRWSFVDDEPHRPKVHEDEAFLKRFGWLSARYRRSRWWYFMFWFSYQFVRACFVGGATTFPLAQVFAVFILDILSLVVIAVLNPYEGQRNTALAVWLLGLAKIATTGLSVAFLSDFNIDRAAATIIGLIIIVIQALLTITLMILIVLGSISSWMSLTRNREEFSPEFLDGVRIKYFEHIARKALDNEPPPPSPPRQSPPQQEISSSKLSLRRASPENGEKPREPPQRQSSFSVGKVRRLSKIEDEDEEFLAEMEPPKTGPPLSAPHPLSRPHRTGSVSSRHSVSSLPRAARLHRTSWSSRDFSGMQPELDRPAPALVRRLSGSKSDYQALSEEQSGVKLQTSFSSLRAPSAPVSSNRAISPAQEDDGKVQQPSGTLARELADIENSGTTTQ